jgi:D-glycero-beta-D-manno-heptose-7-phosphate kinase
MLSLKKNEIEKLFAGFSNVKVLVIGDVMIDSYIWGSVERISPEAPVPVVSVTRRENRLGGAANVVLNLQSLGATPILCSVIGDDARGKDFFELLKENKIPGKGILKSNKRITTTKFRIIGNHTQMLRVDEEMDSDLDQKDSSDFLKCISELIDSEKPAVIIFEDYDKGVITSQIIKTTVDIANKKNIPVAVDPKHKNFSHYKNISLFKPNFKELCEGMKVEQISKQKASLLEICSGFQSKHNIETILLTMSESGIFYSDKDEKDGYYGNILPAQVRNIADVSGAGDTVISLAALCLAFKLKPADIAFISNIAGGLVCEMVGVVPVEKQRLKSELLTFAK